MSGGTDGYVIDAFCSQTWLFRYRSRPLSWRVWTGEPVEFASGTHPRVSAELRAKFGLWAYDIVPRAQAHSGVRRRRELRRADRIGRALCVFLRGEIGPGPVIVYQDQYRDPCGGPSAWQVGDEGDLLPYRHRPSAGYVIDHEWCGEWAWEYQPASRYLVGSDVAQDQTWSGELPIPRDLVIGFWNLHLEWARLDRDRDRGVTLADWDAHNERGLQLSARLKRSLGGAYTVIYLRPYEQPEPGRWPRAMELRLDGSFRPYEHQPYWRQGLRCEEE